MHVLILQNIISCVLFVLVFLAGTIVNAIYASENGGLHGDLCSGFDTVDDDEFCNNFERAIGAQAASVVS